MCWDRVGFTGFAGGRLVGHVQLYNILLSVCHALGADYGQPLAVFIPKK